MPKGGAHAGLAGQPTRVDAHKHVGGGGALLRKRHLLMHCRGAWVPSIVARLVGRESRGDIGACLHSLFAAATTTAAAHSALHYEQLMC